MTQRQVYEQLWFEMFMKYSWSFISPTSPSLEENKRKATIYAVRHTWYWFNNQEAFKLHCGYLSNA